MAPVVTARINTALTGASVTPVHTTTLDCRFLLIFPVFIMFFCLCPNFLCRNATGCWVLVTTPGYPQHCDCNSVPHFTLRSLGWLAAGGLGAACHPIVCNHRGHGHHNQCHIWTRHQAPYRTSSLNSWSGGRCQPGPGSIAFMQIYLLPMTGTLSCLIHRPLSHHPTHHH